MLRVPEELGPPRIIPHRHPRHPRHWYSASSMWFDSDNPMFKNMMNNPDLQEQVNKVDALEADVKLWREYIF